jgi:hypothetical protein
MFHERSLVIITGNMFKVCFHVVSCKKFHKCRKTYVIVTQHMVIAMKPQFTTHIYNVSQANVINHSTEDSPFIK